MGRAGPWSGYGGVGLAVGHGRFACGRAAAVARLAAGGSRCFARLLVTVSSPWVSVGVSRSRLVSERQACGRSPCGKSDTSKIQHSTSSTPFVAERYAGDLWGRDC